MKLAAGVAAVLAIGAGLGTYFGLGGTYERPPVGERNTILEQALDRGVISGYHVVGARPKWWDWRYQATGGAIELRYHNTCSGSCPAGSQRALVFLEYQESQSAQAQILQGIVRARMPYASVYAFEVTSP